MQRRITLVLGLTGAVVVLLAWVASAAPVSVWRELDLDQNSRPPLTAPPRTVSSSTTAPEAVDPPDPVNLGWFLNGIFILVAVALLVVVVWWLSRREWTRPQRGGVALSPLPEVAPEELLEAVDDFDVLIAQGSARNAIVACWVRLEEAVEQAGLGRNPAETAAEMTARVLRTYAVDAGTIGTLAALYREARFSTHDMHEGHRRQAQEALGEVRRQLHAAADLAAAEGPT